MSTSQHNLLITPREINVKNQIALSNVKGYDYVINPYTGCPAGCKYCTKGYNRKYVKNNEPYGSYLDVNICNKVLNAERLTGKSILISAVSDCYNVFEKKYQLTRCLLEQLVNIDCKVTILTKSDLIIRDADIIQKIKKHEVVITVNVLDEDFRQRMEFASDVNARLHTIKILKLAGINTIVALSPIFPGITDYKAIINATKIYADGYWFKPLILKAETKNAVLRDIEVFNHELIHFYRDIYVYRTNKTYWSDLKKEIAEFCDKEGLSYKFFFDDVVSDEQ